MFNLSGVHEGAGAGTADRPRVRREGRAAACVRRPQGRAASRVLSAQGTI